MTIRGTVLGWACGFLALAAAGVSTASPGGRAAEVARLRLEQDFISAFAVAVEDLQHEVSAAEPDSTAVLAILNRVAGLTYEAGDLLATAVALDAALPLARARRGTGPGELGEALLWRGLLDRRIHGPTAARPSLAEADSLLRSTPGNEATFGTLLQGWANLKRSAAGSKAAVPLYEAALAYREKHLERPHIDIADNLVWLGWNLNEAGRYDEAMARLTEAEAELVALGRPDHTLMATILEIRFDRAAMAGDLAECRRLATREVEIFEEARGDFPFGYARAGCPLVAYRRLLWVALGQGDNELAFRCLAREGAPVTQEFFALHEWMHGQGEPHRAELRDLYARVQSCLDGFGTSVDGNGPDLGTSVAALAAWSEIQTLLREHSGEIGRLEFSEAEAQAALDPGTALVASVVFRIGGKNYTNRTIRRQDEWIYVLRHDRPGRWTLSSSAEGDAVRAILDDDTRMTSLIQRAVDWPTRVPADPELDEIIVRKCERIFGPIVSDLDGIETLVTARVRPSAFAFADARMPHNLVATPSVNIFVAQARAGRAAGQTGEISEVLALGDAGPDGDLVWPELELDALRRLFPDATLRDEGRAVEERIGSHAAAGDLSRYDLIHFAGHAVPGGIEERQALLLGGGGRLEAGELLFGYDVHPELVVLSGCSTMAQARPKSDEFHGLAQVFLALGARRILASIWNVDDEATGLIMGRFYENLSGRYEGTRTGREGEPLPPAAALSEAASWLRDLRDDEGGQPWRHPIYWSGFVLFGSP